MIRAKADKILHLQQCYLQKSTNGVSVRLRSSESKIAKYYLTVKVVIDGDVIETEKKIPHEDFKRMSKVAKEWVTKIRYCVGDWEVDFFKDGGKDYFVMAEIELPEGQKAPDKLPSFIKDWLLYSVPKHDGRFSSRKLSDINYAKTLLSELK